MFKMKVFTDRLVTRVKFLIFGVDNVSKMFSTKTGFKIANYYKLYFDLLRRLKNGEGVYTTTGIFELTYPKVFSGGSSFFPKILGTYEKELSSFFLDMNKYKEFVDVGCAEGYYVNGVAKSSKNIICTGFDINQKSIKFANLLKEYNKIGNSSFHLSMFDLKHKFKSKERKLVLIDIEGSEVEFGNEVYANYFATNNCDLIVEMHDFYGNLGLTKNFINSYCGLYDYEIVPSVDDMLKVSTYDVNFEFINDFQKFIALRERGHSNHWLILTKR